MKKDVEVARIHFTAADHERLLRHLHHGDLEQAAFLYVGRSSDADVHVQQVELLGETDFAIQEPYYLELTDEARSRALKSAHKLGLGLSEAHVHPTQTVACFSPSDLEGLWDFAPHVWWRRRGGPFVALVFGQRDFDGLAWIDAPDRVRRLEAIVVDGRVDRASGASWKQF